MAEVVLKNIKKIYPRAEEKKKKSRSRLARRQNQTQTPSLDRQASPQITEEGVVAVQSFNLDIADREFVVLVGPSGCGKSTVLRMIAGLERITEGELYIDGKLVNDALPRERDIAMVFQNYALYPHMTVYENIAFALKLKRIPEEQASVQPEPEDLEEWDEAQEDTLTPPARKWLLKRKQRLPKAEIDAKVRQAAEILDLTDLLKRRPGALSGGQRQRVAIGRAIVREPKVFLMDEPLSNLDAKLRNQMRAEIIKLRQRVDTTFIYVTHDQTEAMTLGDRIVVMRDGFIQQIGTPRQVFDHPANLFVAGFIGSPQMNFFRKAQLVRAGDRYGVALGQKIIPLSEAQNQALAGKGQAAGPVILGLRPEHLTLCDSQHPTAIPCLVEVAELLGSQVQIHGRTNGEEAVFSLATQDLEGDFRQQFPLGRTFHFTFSGSDCHLFQPDTEQNLLPLADGEPHAWAE